MFSLKKFLEGAIAQANPFDHGKTAATVLRPNRPAPPPAQTRPQVQQRQPGGMPSYGSGFSGVVNRYRDVLDANTPQDVYRRNQEKMKQWRAPMEAPKLNQTYREQQIELGNKRPYQNVGATLAGSTARLLNTGEQARQEIFDTARLYGAQARNDVEDLASTNRRIRERQQREYQPDSGLLGQGTIFDKPSDFNTMGAKELTKRVVSTTAGAGLEIAPLSKGAGVTEKILSIAPNAFTRGAIRAGAGALEGGTQDVLEQQVNRDNFSPVQAATSAVFGGVLANAGPAASAVVGKAKQPTTKLIQPKPVDVAPAPTTRLAPPKPVTPVAPTTRLVQTNTPPVQAPVVRAIDPLEALKQEARKYKSAEEFVNSQANLLHGTKADFTEFDPSLLGTNTNAPSAKKGFFFTDTPEIANHYANPGRNFGTAISKNLDDAFSRITERAKTEGLDNSLSNNSGVAMIVGSWPKVSPGTPKESVIKAVISKMDSLKTRFDSPSDIAKIERFKKLTVEELNNTPITELELFGKVMKSKVDFKNPLVIDDKGFRNGASYAKRIDEAIANGHDGLVIKNTQDPLRGNIYVALNKDQILTEKQLTDLYNQATQPPKSTPKAEAPDPLESLKQEAITKTDPRVVDYSSKPKEGTIRLYTNTKGKNVDSILKEGLKTKQRLQGYGADPSEGSVSWFETTPNLKGYGGNTIAVDVPLTARMQKVNDTQYTVFDDLSPDNIVFVDKPLFGNYRTSDIKGLVDKYGDDKVREVFKKSRSKNITEKELDDILSATQPPKSSIGSLKQEARKYKSADEFIRAQGEPVYHGTTEKIQGDFKYPLYTTPKRDYAQVFADSASASSIAKSGVKAKDAAMVHEFAVNPKARVMDIHDPTVRDLLNKEYFGKYSMSDKFYPGQNGHLDWTEGQNLAEFIHDKKLPYDAIKLDEGGGGVDPQFGSKVIDKGVSYLALNKNALRSKQQLTDLYNQATQSQPPKSPLKTADVEAERQVKEGNADPGFMEYYNEVNKSRGSLPDTAKVIEEKAPGKLSEAEWQAKLSQAQKEGVRVTKPTALKRRAEYSERIKEAVQAGDLTEANRLRAESQQFNTEVKLQTKENLPKNAQVLVDETGEVKAPLSLKDRSTKDSFVEATKEYLGKTKSRKIERDARIIDLNKRHTLSNDEKVSAILSIDDSSIRPANQKVSNYVDEFRALTDKAYGDYTSQGIKMGFVQEYLPRLYKHPTTGQAISGNEYRLLTQGSARQRGRSAELLNPDALIYKDPTKILDDYYRSLDNAVTGRKYMDRLEKDGIIVKSNGPVRGLRPIIAEGMQAEDGLIYYAPKDVANKLNNLFGGKEAANLVESVAGTAKNINSLVQSFVLSGGIPNTPVNAFGIMQVTKEAMALHPLKAGKAFFGAGFSKKFSKNLFNKKKDILKLMAEHDVAPRVDLQEVSKTGRQRIKERAGKLGTANQMWDEITNDSTFGRFMPALEVMHFENIYKKALKRKTPEEAAQIAAESTKNFYGRTSDYKLATRAKLTDDTMGAVFFAPKFRESMVNFWGKNVKALGHPTKLEYRDNIKFLTAAAVVYAGYEGLNKAMNGVWMHDNPDGKKDKLLIPDKNIPWDTHGKDIGLPFLSSIATVPRNAVQGLFNAGTGRFTEAKKNAESFLSMPLNTLGDITSNEDYFGGKIVDDNSSVLDKFSQAGAYIAKSNMQPWIREGLNVAGKGLSADLRKKLGIKDKSLTETIANATESPLRFYDPKYYRYSDSWTPRGGKNEKFTIAEQRDRAGIKKEIDAIPGRLGLNKRQKADFDALNAVEFTANGELKEDNNPFYKSQRYTKLQDDGVFEAMKQKAELNAKLNGKPIDPIYNMDGEARRVLLWKKTLPPGTTDPTVKLLYEQDWYQDYRDEESAYYAKKQKWNKKMGYKEPAKNTNEYPKASNEVEKAQNYYFDLPKGTGARSAFIRNNPNLWDKMVGYWDAKDSWTNGERGKLGLGKLEEKTTGYSSSSKGGKYAKGGRKSGGRKASTKSKFGFDPYKFAKKSSKLSDELLALIEQTKTKKRPKAKKAKQMT